MGSLAIRVLTFRADRIVSAAEGAAAAAASALARLARFEVAASAKLEGPDSMSTIAEAHRSRARRAVLSTGRAAILFECFFFFLSKKEGVEVGEKKREKRKRSKSKDSLFSPCFSLECFFRTRFGYVSVRSLRISK